MPLGEDRKDEERDDTADGAPLHDPEPWQARLLEQTRAGVLIFQDGRIVLANQTMIDLSGYPPREFLAWGWEEVARLFPPGDLARIRRAIEDRRAGDTAPRCYTVRFDHRDGTRRWLDLTSWSTSHKGRPAILVVALDATDRLRAEQALRESEARFRTLVETDLVGIVIYQDGRVAYANPGIVKLLGRSVDELLALAPDELEAFVHPADRSRIRGNIRRRLAGEEAETRYAARFRHADGGYRWLEMTARPIRHDGRPAIQAIYIDVTGQQELQAKLRASQQRLRHLVAELTLVEERERRRVAEGLHDHVGQTLAAVSLRLRGLRRELGSEEARRELDETVVLCEQALRRTRSLTFELSPPILHQLGLEPALEWLAEEQAKLHGLRVSFATDRQLKPLSDELRILVFRAAQELLVNVAKHAGSEQAWLSLTCRGERLVLQVTDNGVGFALDDVVVAGGFGLFSIQERLFPYGGELEVGPRDEGPGSVVTLSVPLPLGAAAGKEGPG